MIKTIILLLSILSVTYGFAQEISPFANAVQNISNSIGNEPCIMAKVINRDYTVVYLIGPQTDSGFVFQLHNNVVVNLFAFHWNSKLKLYLLGDFEGGTGSEKQDESILEKIKTLSFHLLVGCNLYDELTNRSSR